MPDFSPLRFGKYLLLETIGTGGMAQLYLAKMTGVEGFEKLAAIKMILPHLSGEEDLVTAFIEEAKLAAQLNHPNIVHIYDFGLLENSYFIAMEYLFGKDLRHILQRAEEKGLPLSLEMALHIVSRICAGLDHAHKLTDLQGKPLQIIHRDISPQNILVTYEGEVKVVDFGIAMAVSQSTVSEHGFIKGKVAYMSPEQASAEKIDFRSDIFSVGILLYEMITRKRMFTGDTLQILEKVRKGEFEPAEALVPDLPPKLKRILERALAANVDQRYPSCGEMQSDIEECMFELSLRPGARGLGDYMKRLFGEEIAAEGKWIGQEPAAKIPDGEISLERDLKFVEEILQKAKETIEEEPSRWRRGKSYLAALGALMVAAAAIWALGFKAQPAGKSPSPSSPPAVAKHSVQAPPAKTGSAGKPWKEERGKERSAEAKAVIDRAAGLVEKNPAQAQSLLLKAVELDPGNARGHFQMALAYMALKNSPRAAESYQRATELDPNFAEAFFNLGYVLAMNHEYSRAEEMYSKTVKLAPAYLDEALFNLSLVQEKQGKMKQCLENLEWALRVNPGNEAARKFLRKLKGNS